MIETPLTRSMLPNDAMGSRIYNALRRGRYDTVESVAAASEANLLKLPGIGARCLPLLRATFLAGEEELREAYRLVIADLEKRADAARAAGARRQYTQSIENARAVVERESKQPTNVHYTAGPGVVTPCGEEVPSNETTHLKSRVTCEACTAALALGFRLKDVPVSDPVQLIADAISSDPDAFARQRATWEIEGI